MNDQDEKKHQGETSRAEQQTEQEAALYGPAGRGEYQKGDVIRFRDAQSGQELTGTILFVRAPGEAVRGGRVHPTVYMVHVEGESLPRAIYPGDIIQER
jgi:hypothetical protein